MSRRPYDRTLRDEQARTTRARILESARQLLLADGYQHLTIAALAESAGVSVQTIYNSVGNKAAVIKAVYDVTLAGDDDPRAMNDRPEFRALAEAPDGASILRAYAALSRRIADRVGPLLAVLLTNSDDDVRAFAATVEDERLHGNATMVGHFVRRFGLPGRAQPPASDRHRVDADLARGVRPPRPPAILVDERVRALARQRDDRRARSRFAREKSSAHLTFRTYVWRMALAPVRLHLVGEHVVGVGVGVHGLLHESVPQQAA